MIGPSETPDGDICAYAREHGYVLLTNDLDFPQMRAADRGKGKRHRSTNALLEELGI